jgi:hypothetical protein
VTVTGTKLIIIAGGELVMIRLLGLGGMEKIVDRGVVKVQPLTFAWN